MKFQDPLHFGSFLKENIIYFEDIFFKKYLELYTKNMNDIKKLESDKISEYNIQELKNMYLKIQDYLDEKKIEHFKNIFNNKKIEFLFMGKTFYVIG
jgi:hypothetical protein